VCPPVTTRMGLACAPVGSTKGGGAGATCPVVMLLPGEDQQVAAFCAIAVGVQTKSKWRSFIPEATISPGVSHPGS